VEFPVSPYIDNWDGALRIAGTRVSLDSVVVCFRDGESPEEIVESFPTLTRAKVYGAIAYYLENEQLIDEYLAEVHRDFLKLVRPLSETNPELLARLLEARRQMTLQRT
jgi:uncharacterized protein (DUF433 family)